MTPYYDDGVCTIYHGDCREVAAWLEADVLVTDPPYGRGWRQGWTRQRGQRMDDAHAGIAGDADTTMRDEALRLWGDRIGVAFGDLMLPQPASTKQVCVYRKPSNAGTKGTRAGFRRDLEAIYLLGPWPSGLGGRSSLLTSGSRSHCSPAGVPGRYGHPHAKPVDVMETLIAACPSGTVADPFMGSGSTLVAARNLGRRCVGVEIEERYCEIAAKRLAQEVLDLSDAG